MVGQQPIQAAQTGLCMMASIKTWVNIHYGMFSDSGGTSKIYDSLCYFTSVNASPANKCHHRFQPGGQIICFFCVKKIRLLVRINEA